MVSITVRLPYGKGEFKVSIPKRNLLGILKPNDLFGVKVEEEIQRAIHNPVRSKRLCDIAKKGDKVAIVATDNTRRCPDGKIIPFILRELALASVPEHDISIVVALGMHRMLQKDELINKFGKNVCTRIRVLNHDAQDKKSLCYVGQTSRLKTPVWVNRTVAEADVKITTGVVEFHTFAGYSGGRKSISPGVAGKETIIATHGARAIDQPNVGVGMVENNPIHDDMVEAAKLVGVDFIVNVVLNSKDEIVRVAAGDLVHAHEELIETHDQMYKVKATEPADIAIAVPAAPKNINLYQATRAATNLVLTSKPMIQRGGTVIIPAICQDGVGSEIFYRWMKTAKDACEVIERTYEETKEVVVKPFLLAKILRHVDITITNSMVPNQLVTNMHMTARKNVQEGLELALQKLGPDAKIAVLLHAVSTLPV